MRCNECNVDLGEDVKVCPLCHKKAVDEKPLIEGMKVAEYPEYGELRPLKYYIRKDGAYFGKKLICAVIAVSLIVLAVSVIFKFVNVAVYTVLPIIFALTSLVYFITSYVNKKNGVKSAVYLITLAVFSGIIIAVGYFTTKETGTVFYALASALVSLLGLMILSSRYAKEMDEELKARFHH